MNIKSGGRSLENGVHALGNTVVAGLETGQEVAETARNTAHTVRNVVHAANKGVIAVGNAAETVGATAKTVGKAAKTVGVIAETTGNVVKTSGNVVDSAGKLVTSGLGTLGHVVSTETSQARQKGALESAREIGKTRGQRRLAKEEFQLQQEILQQTQKIHDLQRRQKEARRRSKEKNHYRIVKNGIKTQKQLNNFKRLEGKRKLSSKQKNFLDESASVYITMINELLNSNQFKNGKISSVDVKLKSKENRKKLWEYATKGKKQSGMFLKKDVKSELLELIGDDNTNQETKKLFLNLLVRKIEQFVLNKSNNVEVMNLNNPNHVQPNMILEPSMNVQSNMNVRPSMNNDSEKSVGGMRKYKTKKRKHKKTKKNKRKKSRKAKKIMKPRRSIKARK